MAATTILDLKNATLKFKDGGVNELEIFVDEGNLQYTIRRNIEYRKNRGALSGGAVREGDEEACEISLSCRFDHIRSTSGDAITIQEFLTKTGAASAFATTGSACEPHAVDLEVTMSYTCGTVEDEIITFSEFRYEEIGGDFSAAQLDISGKSNEVMPSAIRTTL